MRLIRWRAGVRSGLFATYSLCVIATCSQSNRSHQHCLVKGPVAYTCPSACIRVDDGVRAVDLVYKALMGLDDAVSNGALTWLRRDVNSSSPLSYRPVGVSLR
jgi:hypothetical protein